MCPVCDQSVCFNSVALFHYGSEYVRSILDLDGEWERVRDVPELLECVCNVLRWYLEPERVLLRLLSCIIFSQQLLQTFINLFFSHLTKMSSWYHFNMLIINFLIAWQILRICFCSCLNLPFRLIKRPSLESGDLSNCRPIYLCVLTLTDLNFVSKILKLIVMNRMQTNLSSN